MMNLMYFVQLLLEEYDEDSELNYLINNREIWFIPVVNPDGYVYNELIEPNGGGMHRKNRLDTNCGNGDNRGVDLNRNYGYGWDQTTGSSPNPCSTTYRGESEFSQKPKQFEILSLSINSRMFYTITPIGIHTYILGEMAHYLMSLISQL